MRRLVWIAAILVVGALALVLLAPLLVSSEAVKAQLAGQISAWTGRDVALRGDPVIRLIPDLAVTLNDVSVAGPDDMPQADIVRTETLRTSVRFLPLLLGEVQVESFQIIRPQIRLVRDENGRRNWLFDSGVAALQLAFAGDVPLGTFEIVDGTLTYEDVARGTIRRLDDVDLRLSWPSVRAPIRMEGSAVWRGETVTLRANVADPLPFLQGESTPAEGALSAPSVEARFSGAAYDFEAPRLEGAVTVEAPSLPRLASWFGIGPGEAAEALPLRLEGQATVTFEELSMREAAVALGENRATGLVRVLFGKVPVVSGRLASPSVDLTPYVPGLARIVEGREGDWRSASLDTDWLDDVEVDLQLSAERIGIGRLAAGDVAASVQVGGGAIEIGLEEASFHGGTLSGSLSVAEAEGTASGAAQLRAVGFRVADAAASLGLTTELAGVANGEADLATRGATLGEALINLDGTMSVGARDGRLPGLGLDALAEALRAGIVPSPARPGGATAFRTFDAAAAFSDGLAILNRAAIQTAAYAATATGRIGLEDGALALQGAVTLPGAAPAPFTIAGTLLDPQPRLGAQPVH